MTDRGDLKKLIRERQEKTGETYTAARRHVLAAKAAAAPTPVPATAPEPTGRPRNKFIETTNDEARALLDRALAAEPRLTHFGLGLYDEPRRRLEARSSGTIAQLDADFAKERADLGTHLDEIAACADWVKRQRPIASFNRKHNSYGYKHRVERWFRERGEHMYVANGSFIAAAVGLGYEAKADYDSPNPCFKFSERTITLSETITKRSTKIRWGHPVLDDDFYGRVISFMHERGWNVGARRSRRGTVTIPSPRRGEEYDFHDLAFEERLATSGLLDMIGYARASEGAARIQLFNIAGTFPEVPSDIGGKSGVVLRRALLDGIAMLVVRLDGEKRERIVHTTWIAVDAPAAITEHQPQSPDSV